MLISNQFSHQLSHNISFYTLQSTYPSPGRWPPPVVGLGSIGRATVMFVAQARDLVSNFYKLAPELLLARPQPTLNMIILKKSLVQSLFLVLL